jgi:hypothetical protein
MKMYTTEYKTSKESGTVTISKENGKHYIASFDGREEIKITLCKKGNVSALCVNLKCLKEIGFNVPLKDLIVAIALPKVKNHKEFLNNFKENIESGKFCGDGIFRTHKNIKNLSYTESVLSGEYTE